MVTAKRNLLQVKHSNSSFCKYCEITKVHFNALPDTFVQILFFRRRSRAAVLPMKVRGCPEHLEQTTQEENIGEDKAFPHLGHFKVYHSVIIHYYPWPHLQEWVRRQKELQTAPLTGARAATSEGRKGPAALAHPSESIFSWAEKQLKNRNQEAVGCTTWFSWQQCLMHCVQIHTDTKPQKKLFLPFFSHLWSGETYSKQPSKASKSIMTLPLH